MREDPRPEERGSAVPRSSSQDDRAEAERIDQRHRVDLRKARQAKVAKVLVLLAVVVVFIIFVLQNADPVAVDFIFATGRPRMIWVIVACTVLGGVVGYLIGRPKRRIRFHSRGDEPPNAESPGV